MSYSIDQTSFKLGALAAFSEMVGIDLKKMALSSAFLPDEYQDLDEDAKKIAKRWGAQIRLEKKLITTDLFREDIAKGKWVYIIFKDPEVINQYFDLKMKKEQLIKEKKYQGKERKAIAVNFGKLLSYNMNAIEDLIKNAAT